MLGGQERLVVQLILNNKADRYLPSFLQAKHCPTVRPASGNDISCVPRESESASQTGVVEVISHPSAFPEINPHVLQ